MKEFFDWLLNALAIYIFIGIGGFGLLLGFVTVLAGSLMPKQLQVRYLVEPYFSKRECFIYSFWPGLFFFTWMLMYATVLPNWRGLHKRNLKDLRQVAPVWFQVLLYIMALASIVLLTSILVMFVAVGGHLLFV